MSKALEFFKENNLGILKMLDLTMSLLAKVAIEKEDDEDFSEEAISMLREIGGNKLLISFIEGSYDEEVKEFVDPETGENFGEGLVMNASINTFEKAITALEHIAINRFVSQEGREDYERMLGMTCASYLVIKALSDKFGLSDKFEELASHLKFTAPDLYIKMESYKERNQW